MSPLYESVCWMPPRVAVWALTEAAGTGVGVAAGAALGRCGPQAARIRLAAATPPITSRVTNERAMTRCLPCAECH